MESEKVKEIKENIGKKISNAELVENVLVNCVEVKLLRNILTLINELESENKQLLKENESLNGSWKNALKRIAELEKQMCKNEDLHRSTEKLNDMIILKQFAERLKEKLKDNVNGDNVDNYVECAKFISETLKEFTGE